VLASGAIQVLVVGPMYAVSIHFIEILSLKEAFAIWKIVYDW